MAGAPSSRSRSAPEVLQSSAMDCGPASLCSWLLGEGIATNVEELRVLCHTNVDGTSVDSLEGVAQDFGLACSQRIVPMDAVAHPGADILPCIAVTRLPGGDSHFVLLWNRHGSRLQVMDPGRGREILPAATLISDLSSHEYEVSAEDFMALSQEAWFVEPLKTRLENLAIGGKAKDLIQAARQDTTGDRLASLDAITRFLEALFQATSPGERREMRRRLSEIDILSLKADIPPDSYFARVEASGAVTLRGAVVLRRDATAGAATPKQTIREREGAPHQPAILPLLAEMLGESAGARLRVMLTFAVALAGVLVIESVVIGGSISLGSVFSMPRQQIQAVAVVAVMIAALNVIEIAFSSYFQYFGRRLETAFRVRLFEKVPRLGIAYFRTRLASDLAERAHSIHLLRNLPGLMFEVILQISHSILILLCLFLLARPAALVGACAVVAVSVVLAKLAPRILEREGRLRAATVASTKYFLESLLGLLPIRAQGAERALETQQAAAIADWTRALGTFGGALVTAHALQVAAITLATVLMVYLTFVTTHDIVSAAVVAFWSARLGTSLRSLWLTWMDYPIVKMSLIRLLEPLQVREEPPPVEGDARISGPARIEVRGVSVTFRESPVLRDISFTIEPGERVALVGASGAGKSTIIGLLLGHVRPGEGEIRVAGEVLDPVLQAALRRATAWVDPSVYLWNDTVLANLVFGVEDSPADRLLESLNAAELLPVVERLPQGMSSSIGDGGARLSGGEGQRLRFARALTRPTPSLVLLDEPFRGLERSQRARLLRCALEHFGDATILCATHDVGETSLFSRVLVIEGGQVVEAGRPDVLRADPRSRLSQLLRAEEAVRERLTSRPWRRIRVQDGGAVEHSYD